MAYATPNDKIYNSWHKMIVRCTDPTYHSYHRYGGRGIKPSADWEVYENFKRDMGSTWFEGATVERLDNNLGYNRDNCEWRTKAENSKPLKYDLAEMLALSDSGLTQREVGEYYNLTQDRVSKLLKRARNGKSLP